MTRRIERAPILLLALVAALGIEGAAQEGSTAPMRRDLWEAPTNLATRDLFTGPWGAARAPDPAAVYEYIAAKRGGINPGMTVRDPRGRECSPRSTSACGCGN